MTEEVEKQLGMLDAIRVRIDEMQDVLVLELNQVAEMMDNGDFSSARAKIRAMIQSIEAQE